MVDDAQEYAAVFINVIVTAGLYKKNAQNLFLKELNNSHAHTQKLAKLYSS